MSDRIRLLLDKVTARHILTGLLRLAEARELTDHEMVALNLYNRIGTRELRQFIMPSTENVLRRLEERPRYAAILRLFRQRVEVAFPTRYFKRWTRRLQGYGFTPEDAGVLALATFGTDSNTSVLGMHAVVTFDQAMVTQWATRQTAIQAHFAAMQRNLPMPYHQTDLPQVIHPEDINRVSNLSIPS